MLLCGLINLQLCFQSVGSATHFSNMPQLFRHLIALKNTFTSTDGATLDVTEKAYNF